MASRQSSPEDRPAGLCDVHHHLLFGLDDGPATLEAMEAMIDLAVLDGTGTLLATPHALPGEQPFPLARCRETLALARDYCRRKQYALRILEGAEVLYSPAAADEVCRGSIPTLNGTAFVLVEWPCSSTAAEIADGLRCLNNQGLIPVLAHAERLVSFRRHPGELIDLRERLDMRIQLNAHAIIHPDILRSAGLVRRLMKAGAVDYIASDAHNLSDRKTCLTGAFTHIAKAYGVPCAQRLLRDNQRELTDGD